VLDAVLRGRRLRARILAMRRVMRAMFADAYRAEGPSGVLRLVGAMFFKAPVHRNKLVQYKRLSLLPDGTLGRAYWKHMTENGFALPGEIGGIPDFVAYHDVGHVLAAHEATPLGEIQQGSFQGGSRRDDGFALIQFAILQFHQGIRITPITAPQTGNFDPAKVLWAIHRGAQCKLDITRQRDFWPLMSLPLEEARRRCALLPKLAPAA
jgi:ubiquinone biosynthesis protein Coq4